MKYTRTAKGMVFAAGRPRRRRRPVRRPPLRRPELHPPGHAVRPGEIQGPLLHRQAREDDGRVARLRPSALHDLLLHLRGREPDVDSGGGHPPDRPGREYLAEFLTPKGEGLAAFRRGDGRRRRRRGEEEGDRGEVGRGDRLAHPGREIKPILDAHFEDPFWNTLHRSASPAAPAPTSAPPATASTSATR